MPAVQRDSMTSKQGGGAHWLPLRSARLQLPETGQARQAARSFARTGRRSSGKRQPLPQAREERQRVVDEKWRLEAQSRSGCRAQRQRREARGQWLQARRGWFKSGLGSERELGCFDCLGRRHGRRRGQRSRGNLHGSGLSRALAPGELAGSGFGAAGGGGAGDCAGTTATGFSTERFHGLCPRGGRRRGRSGLDRKRSLGRRRLGHRLRRRSGLGLGVCGFGYACRWLGLLRPNHRRSVAGRRRGGHGRNGLHGRGLRFGCCDFRRWGRRGRAEFPRWRVR